MKPILLRILLSSVIIILAIIFVLYILLPKQPASWNEISLGMTSAEVYALDPEFNTKGWKDVKGFDLMTVKKGDDYWQFLLYYNEDDKVESTTKRLYYGALDRFIINEISK